MSRTITILILILTSDAKIQPAMQGRQLLLTFITIVTRWSHSTSNFYLCPDWSKFDKRVHAENICSIWKLVY